MALKGILATLDGLDEATQKLYKKRDDGKFVLDVEGMVDKDKLDEFRTNNVELEKRVNKLVEQAKLYEGIDPAKAKEALEQLQQIQDKKMLDEGKIEELFAQRTGRMKSEFDEQLKAKESIIGQLKGEIEKVGAEKNKFILFTQLQRALEDPELGFQPGVADLVKEQVFREFQYRDEKVVRVDKEGKLVYGKNGDAVGLSEFLTEVAKEKPYLVKPSQGGGARDKGNNNNGNNGQKQVNRATFEGFSDLGKFDFVKSGGKVVDA